MGQRIHKYQCTLYSVHTVKTIHFLQLGKEAFHKSHHFDYCNDVSMLVGLEKPGIGGELLLGQKIKSKHSVYPRGEGTNAPAWVAFDRQVHYYTIHHFNFNCLKCFWRSLFNSMHDMISHGFHNFIAGKMCVSTK